MTDNTNMNPQTQQVPFNDKILVELFQELVSGQEIELKDIMQRIKHNENYDKIVDWAIKNKICTQREWNQAIKNYAGVQKLGGYAENPTIMIDLFTDKYEVEMNYKKEVIHFKESNARIEKIINNKIAYEQSLPQNRPLDFKEEFTIRGYEEKLTCLRQDIDMNDIARKIRILSTELELRFTNSDIADALDEWVKNKRVERVCKIYDAMSYATTNIKGPRGEYAWVELASSMFESRDKDDLSLPAKISIIKKFMWQVKRKILKKDIENHIMPIFIGGQGTGKTTLINKLLEPIEELTINTDFKQITDDRNIDIWEFYVHKTDEMGWASRSDIDNIKFLMTAKFLNRRFMRTNSSTPVRQKATFIGASNRELTQLIRDESGMRRFAGIKVRNDPDWERMNRVRAIDLWKSIDDMAEDPTLEFMDEIRAYQERARVETSTELWMNSLPPSFGDKCVNSFDLFPVYKDWESTHYSKRKMDFDEWEAEMCRLVTETGSQYPFIVNNFGVSKEFQFIPSRAKNRNSLGRSKQEAMNKIRVERNREFAKMKLEYAQDYVDMCDKKFDCSNDPDIIEYLEFLDISKDNPDTTEENQESEVESKETVITPLELDSNSTKEETKAAMIVAKLERIQKEKNNIIINKTLETESDKEPKETEENNQDILEVLISDNSKEVTKNSKSSTKDETKSGEVEKQDFEDLRMSIINRYKKKE